MISEARETEARGGGRHTLWDWTHHVAEVGDSEGLARRVLHDGHHHARCLLPPEARNVVIQLARSRHLSVPRSGGLCHDRCSSEVGQVHVLLPTRVHQRNRAAVRRHVSMRCRRPVMQGHAGIVVAVREPGLVV